MTQNLDTNKILSALSHGSIFFNSLFVAIGIPIAILLLNNDSVVRGNAKEAINFHLNMFIAWIVVVALCFIVIGFVLLPFLVVINIVMPIIAIVQTASNPYKIYRYPFIIRLI